MRTRSPLSHKVLNKYMNMDQYFETVDGKKLFEYIKTNKPLVIMFVTRAGRIEGVEVKEFVESAPAPIEQKPVVYDKPKEINPAFQRMPDPIESVIEEEPVIEDGSDDKEEVAIGCSVKYMDAGIEFVGTVVGIYEDEGKVEIESDGKLKKVVPLAIV